MTTVEERLARVEGTLDHLATKADVTAGTASLKADIGHLQGQLQSLRWMMGVTGAALATLIAVLKYVG